MKCVILFGGRGTRVSLLSQGKNKALIDINGKPVAYYVLKNISSLFEELIIITNPSDVFLFKELCKTYFPNHNIKIKEQPFPGGIAHALNFAKEEVQKNPYFFLHLGDLYCEEVRDILNSFHNNPRPFLTLNEVSNPKDYGIFNPFTGKIVEKPKENLGRLATRGFYILPSSCLELIKDLSPSKRGELEITDLLNKVEKFNTHMVKEVFDLGSESGILKFKNRS